MDILALAQDWSNPMVVASVIVGLLVTVRFLSARTKKVEDTVLTIKDNHLKHVGESLVRIETKLDLLPCKDPSTQAVHCEYSVDKAEPAEEFDWSGLD